MPWNKGKGRVWLKLCEACGEEFRCVDRRTHKQQRFCSRSCVPNKGHVHQDGCKCGAPKGIRNSPATEFKKGQRSSPATEFKKGQPSRNKGTGERVVCRTCEIEYPLIEGGEFYCSKRCQAQDDEWRKKMSDAKTNPSQETRKRISDGGKRRFADIDARKRMSAIKQGVSLEEWDGFQRVGRLKDMGQAHYRAWRRLVFERDDFTCQECHIRGGFIHAHHVLSYAKHPELRYDIENGLTLCKECHMARHKKVVV